MSYNFDSAKPKGNVPDAWKLLEDIILGEIRKRPVTAAVVLERVKPSAIQELEQVTAYLFRNGFVEGQEINPSVVLRVLRINPLTGRGDRASLSTIEQGSLLYYSPGYTRNTPLHQFLMQELLEPLTRIDFGGRGSRTLHPRQIRVNAIMRRLRQEILNYEALEGKAVHVKGEVLTIDKFLNLPQNVVAIFQKNIYSLLSDYGFTSGPGSNR